MRNCSFCKNDFTPIFTSPDSLTSGWYMRLQGYADTDKKYLLFASREKFNGIEIPANFCPICGRNLSKPYVQNTEQDYCNIIRRNVKKVIDEQRVTISELARKTGISKGMLSEFLSGKVNSISAGKIALIADVLSVSVDELLYD